ncbi:MAG: hypothetical protein JJU33_09440 [Phycisphaerales bacterium]|nr:hypothetical protein [Phycisphaerales bacterium]
MMTDVFRFRFASSAALAEAEATLHLSILAAEGLFGEARVRTDVSYHADPPRGVLLVDGGSPCGAAVVRIFTAFLIKEFGADGFTVRRMPCATPKGSPAREARGVAA